MHKPSPQRVPQPRFLRLPLDNRLPVRHNPNWVMVCRFPCSASILLAFLFSGPSSNSRSPLPRLSSQPLSHARLELPIHPPKDRSASASFTLSCRRHGRAPLAATLAAQPPIFSLASRMTNSYGRTGRTRDRQPCKQKIREIQSPIHSIVL